MSSFYEGNAIVYCEGAFGSTYGKNAHGLVRRTDRYRVLSVVDSTCVGKDAGEILYGNPKGIPIYADLEAAVSAAVSSGNPATHLVIGLAQDGGRLNSPARKQVLKAIELGLNVDSGLHDFLMDDLEIAERAARSGIEIRDIRRTPPRAEMHSFTGKISEVTSLRIAVLGTDSAVGKRTTAWLLVDALKEAGYRAELIGTGQTAWMQGAKYGIILDSLINDFVAGEIEHIVWTAWKEEQPDALILEGQGSLLNPAYPGGFEIMAAGRPDAIVLQHAPGRKDYDGFPGYPLHPLGKQIAAIELISGRSVIAITVNHEGLPLDEIRGICRGITEDTGLPACDPFLQGMEEVLRALQPYKKI